MLSREAGVSSFFYDTKQTKHGLHVRFQLKSRFYKLHFFLAKHSCKDTII